MSKKHFIELANEIKDFNRRHPEQAFTEMQINRLADFCAAQNPAFNYSRWLAYIAGECGPGGEAVK